jgi:transcriptional regulator with XRE-family HTH domain
MESVRVGRTVRALRHRLNWTQSELARRAGVSQSLISLIERGRIESIAIGKLVAVLRALDADLVVFARWRGGDLDRLLDEAHATILGVTARLLVERHWVIEAEVTYAIDREIGSIDLLAWLPATSTVLVVEVKSDLVSVEETLRRHDAKARLAARIAAERFGWQARMVVRMLVLPEGTTPRRRVARHDSVLQRAYPVRGQAARNWLSAPDGPRGILLFVPSPATNRDRSRRSSPIRKRVRSTSAMPSRT